METITPGKYVELTYEVFVVDGDSRSSMMQFTDEKPDRFVFGVEQGMLPEFSKRLQGLKKGDSFDFTLTPDQAFGEHDDKYVMEIDKSTFYVDGEFDDKQVFVGNAIQMMTDDGYRVQGIVLNVGDDKVSMDFNHPLAGETVQYVGSVKLVRDATVEEVNPPKHECGCGCDHCGGDHDDCCDGDGCGDGCGDCHK